MANFRLVDQDPSFLLALLFYRYDTGTFSSRKIEKASFPECYDFIKFQAAFFSRSKREVWSGS